MIRWLACGNCWSRGLASNPRNQKGCTGKQETLVDGEKAPVQLGIRSSLGTGEICGSGYGLHVVVVVVTVVVSSVVVGASFISMMRCKSHPSADCLHKDGTST